MKDLVLVQMTMLQQWQEVNTKTIQSDQDHHQMSLDIEATKNSPEVQIEICHLLITTATTCLSQGSEKEAQPQFRLNTKFQHNHRVCRSNAKRESQSLPGTIKPHRWLDQATASCSPKKTWKCCERNATTNFCRFLKKNSKKRMKESCKYNTSAILKKLH